MLSAGGAGCSMGRNCGQDLLNEFTLQGGDTVAAFAINEKFPLELQVRQRPKTLIFGQRAFFAGIKRNKAFLQKIGMENQMKSLANLGLLGNFVGMLTDSRSFLSYTRHDYFRRILCNLIGQWVEDGEYPNDEKALEKIVKGICFDNAKRYFAL